MSGSSSLLLRGVGAVAAAAAFDPASISGLVGWYKADALALADNDPVASWTDSSGNGNHLTEATNRPTYKTNILGGKAVVRFDGSNDTLLKSGFNLAQPDTIAMVVIPRRVNGTQNFIIDSQTSNRQAIFWESDNNWQMYAGSLYDSGLTPVVNTAYRIVATFNGASSEFRLNGSANACSVGTQALTDLMLAKVQGGASFGQVDIAELLLYNSALGSTDKGNLESYFATKYGL